MGLSTQPLVAPVLSMMLLEVLLPTCLWPLTEGNSQLHSKLLSPNWSMQSGLNSVLTYFVSSWERAKWRAELIAFSMDHLAWYANWGRGCKQQLA